MEEEQAGFFLEREEKKRVTDGNIKRERS